MANDRNVRIKLDLDLINNDSNLKNKFDELYLYRIQGKDERLLQEEAKNNGYENAYQKILYEVIHYEGGIDVCFKEMKKVKDTEEYYIKLIKENYDILLLSGISKQYLDKVINEEGRKYPSMSNEICATLFAIETLKTLNQIDLQNFKLSNIEISREDWWNVYGYRFVLNDQQSYAIILDREKFNLSADNKIYFNSIDEDQIKKEIELLKKFVSFGSSSSILSIIEKYYNKKKLKEYLKKLNNNPQLKAKLDELFENYRSLYSDEELQKIAERKGLSSAYEDYLCNMISFDIEGKYESYAKEKEISDQYLQLIRDNYYLLLHEGFSKEELDDVLNKKGLLYPNMTNRIIQKMFVLDALRIFNKYDSNNCKIKDIERYGGDYYSDGDIYGYKVELDNGNEYLIVLDSDDINRMDCKDNSLIFGQCDDEEQATRELMMLQKYVKFSNSRKISIAIKHISNNANTSSKHM